MALIYVFMKRCFVVFLMAWMVFLPMGVSAKDTGKSDRMCWVKMLDRIARPVIWNMSEETLKKNMPRESLGKPHDMAYLEAFGRTVCGLGPWLELGADDTKEGKLRAEYIERTLKGLSHAVDVQSPDHLLFKSPQSRQPLVDAAFLCEGIVRARTQIMDRMDATTRENLIRELKLARTIQPYESNWLLFASMIEATLLDMTGECDTARLNYGVRRFMKDGWYKGDGLYGDGPDFHLDFYNSIVIHPMLTDVLQLMVKHGMADAEKLLKTQLKRQERFAVQLERLISPEGTYPVVGRSICYRFGVFHSLAHTAFYHRLPDKLKPGQVRSAMTALMCRQMKTKGNFDADGWLTIGLSGHQLKMSENYINTGSTYMCMAYMLPLGLPADDVFWTAPYEPWTNLKAWKGIDVGADHAL